MFASFAMIRTSSNRVGQKVACLLRAGEVRDEGPRISLRAFTSDANARTQSRAPIYFDCAGSNRKEPFCVVAAVIVHENHWQWLDHYSRHALVPLWSSRAPMTKKAREQVKQGKFESHGHELFNGKGPWPRNAKAKVFRFNLLEGFLDVPKHVRELGINAELPIVYGATYTPELIRRYGADAWDAEEVAFILCMEQVERFFRESCDEEKGLLLGDRSIKTEFAIRNLGEYMRAQSADWP